MVQVAAERGIKRRVVVDEAREMLDALAHNMNSGAVRILGYAVRKIVNTIYTDVRIDPDQLAVLAETIKSSPVLLLPTHRSYMDFIILSYAFLCADVPIPIIAAGQDFQSMAVVAPLLQGWSVLAGLHKLVRTVLRQPHLCCRSSLDPLVGSTCVSGAFFIRRSFGSDKLYWAIISNYIQVCLDAIPPR